LTSMLQGKKRREQVRPWGNLRGEIGTSPPTPEGQQRREKTYERGERKRKETMPKFSRNAPEPQHEAKKEKRIQKEENIMS